MAYLGKSPSQGVRNRYYKTASGGETSISGALTGGTLTFTDGNYVDVILNGVTLVAGTDYNTSTANTIAGLTALTASDVVEIVVYDVFSVFSGNVNSDFSVGGNLVVTGTVDIDGGAIDGTAIGASSASTGAFTTVSASSTASIVGHASIGVNAVSSTRALTVAGATDGSSSTILQLYNSSLASKFSVRDDGFVDINGPVDMSSTLQVDGVLSTSSNLKSSSSSSGGFNALTISHASNTSGDESRIQFKRTTDAGSDREVAAIVADRLGGNDTDLVFETNTDGSDGATERVRISHDGVFMVGKTAASFDNAGFQIQQDGQAAFTRDDATVLYVNRQTSEGNTLEIRQDNDAQLIIGSKFSGRGYISTNASNTTGIRFDTNFIAPCDHTGANRDNAIDVGSSGARFKRGYFNATVFAAGVGGISDDNTYINFAGSDVMQFFTGGSERARIDQNGDVGIGTSSTGDARLHIVSSDTHQLKLQSSSGDITRFQGDSFITTRNGDFFFDNRNQDTNNFQYRCGTTAAHIFSCGTSEKARVNTQSIIVGKTSNGSLSDAGSELNTSGYGMFSRSTGTVLFLNRNDTGASINFYRNSVQVGNISVDSSSTAFNTSSDRRLKSNIEDAESASDKIDSIQVRQFDWNTNGEHQDYGLIAQELQPIEPMAVSGDENSDEMMGVDYSKLVPMLIKAVQEQQTTITALEARIAALEAE
jgi:hypothetical protein